MLLLELQKIARLSYKFHSFAKLYKRSTNGIKYVIVRLVLEKLTLSKDYL